jgi:hypothetical protein
MTSAVSGRPASRHAIDIIENRLLTRVSCLAAACSVFAAVLAASVACALLIPAGTG